MVARTPTRMPITNTSAVEVCPPCQSRLNAARFRFEGYSGLVVRDPWYATFFLRL